MVDAGLENGSKLGDEADVGQALLHDNRGRRAVAVVAQGLGEGLAGDAVPAVGLDEGEGAVDFEIEGVVRAHGRVVVFGADVAGDAQRRGGRVEKERLDLDGEVDVDSFGLRSAGARVGEGDFADGVAADSVADDNEVICVPL